MSLARIPAPKWPLERWAVVAAAISLVAVPALILLAEVLASDFVANDQPAGVTTGDGSAIALMAVAMVGPLLGWTLLAARAWHARRVEHVANRALNVPATQPSVRPAAPPGAGRYCRRPLLEPYSLCYQFGAVQRAMALKAIS